MSKVLLLGLRSTLRRWPVVMFLYAALLAPTLIFGAISWTRLQAALDHSLAARTLLKDLDLNVFVDLLVHHPDMFVAIAITGLLLGAGALTVWVWLNAATIAAAGDEEALGEALRRASGLFSRFFRLWVVALCVNTAIVAVFYFVARSLLYLTAESTAEMTRYWVIGSCALLAASVLMLSTVVHDHARIHCASTEIESGPAYRWALRFCLRDEPRTILLALVILACGLAVWGGYQSIAMLVPTTSSSGVIVSLVWGQLLILTRAAIRFWYFAAANELQAAAASEADL